LAGRYTERKDRAYVLPVPYRHDAEATRRDNTKAYWGRYACFGVMPRCFQGSSLCFEGRVLHEEFLVLLSCGFGEAPCLLLRRNMYPIIALLKTRRDIVELHTAPGADCGVKEQVVNQRFIIK